MAATSRGCPRCGTETEQGTRFCGQCGYDLDAAPAVTQDPKRTALGLPAVVVPGGYTPGDPPPEPARADFAKTIVSGAPVGAEEPLAEQTLPERSVHSPEPAPKPAKPMNRTMLGMPAVSKEAATPPSAVTPAAATPPVASEPAAKPGATNRTMLGMPAQSAAQAQQAGPASASNVPAAATNRTMLGMNLAAAPAEVSAAAARVPPTTDRTMQGMAQHAPAQAGRAPAGSAPTPSSGYQDVSIAGLPSKRRRRSRAGAMLGILLVLVALVAAAGVGWWYTHRAPEVRASVVNTPTGEALQIEVPGGEDGAKVRFAGREVPLEAGRARFPLGSNELQMGDNTLSVDLVDANGSARTVPIVLSQRFRVRPDLSGLDAAEPTLRVVVDALPGSTVTVDEQPVTLDASGHGALSVPVEGGEGNAFEHSFRYRVVPPTGTPAEGSVDVVIPFVTLQVDRPAANTVTDAAQIEVAGAVHPEATVTVAGETVAVREGRFLARVPLTAMGEHEVEVVATREGRAPKRIVLRVRRVEDLAREAAQYEVDAALTYARVAANPETYLGQHVAFEGRVYNAGTQDGRSMVQILVRDCASGQRCPMWVNYDGARPPEINRWVRVLGEFSGEQQFRTSSGEVKRIPRVDAAFVLESPS